MKTVVFWTLLGFLLGSLPFSVWIGKFALHKDILAVGDHNPGATNVLRAGTWGWFLLALFLDISKGALATAIPVQLLGLKGWGIVPIALSAPLGHAFSPFLRGRGGKAIAASFGVWIGLTLWKIPLLTISLLVFFALFVRPHGWAVLFTLLIIAIVFPFWIPDPVLWAAFGGPLPILAYTHRNDLKQRPSLRLKEKSA